jgi:hypothetical protein
MYIFFQLFQVVNRWVRSADRSEYEGLKKRLVFSGSLDIQTTQKTPDQNLYRKYKPPTITKISSAIKPTHHNKFLVFPSS